MNISAVLITFNEEDNIAAALESVAWADERLVVDSNSTDHTADVARACGARVISNAWPGFSEQKQFGADSAANDWVFSLDADERASPELAAEIQALDSDGSVSGYSIPRLSIYMRREIRHSGWYPDRQLRLFDRRNGRWNGRKIHESFELAPGSVSETLRNHIFHFSVKHAAYHHRMIGDRYAPLGAQQMYESGRRTTKLKVTTAGISAFLRSYVLKLGFLDGFPGFCIARFAAHNAYLKHLLLWEMQQGVSIAADRAVTTNASGETS